MAYEFDEFPVGYDFAEASKPRKHCFACDRRLGKNPNIAICEDEQSVLVGSECFKKIGPKGWQPPKGGPRLYRGKFAPDGTLLEVVGLKNHSLIGKKVLGTMLDPRKKVSK